MKLGTWQSSLLNSISGVRHGFGDRKNPIPLELQAPWKEQALSWKQVHGVSLAEVRNRGDSCGEVDGMIGWGLRQWLE